MRLARLVGKQRCLLVLDGMEPLQYPPGPMEGKLKDPPIEALLKGLSAQNAGLCVVTTREKVPDIRQHYGRTADDIPLTALTDLSGAALLPSRSHARRAKKIKPDDKELQATSREVRGHGLTLQLLGQYLRLIEESGKGDILKRGTVHLADADREYQNDATRPYGLGLGTFVDKLLGSCFVDHGLELSPAFPEDQPSGMAVVFSVQVAAEACEREAEVVDRPVRFRNAVATCAQDRYIFIRE